MMSILEKKVAEIVTTYHPAGKNGSEEKGEVYERLLDQSVEAQELRQQKRNQIPFPKDSRDCPSGI